MLTKDCWNRHFQRNFAGSQRKADQKAIDVFAENLQQLLLAAHLVKKRIWRLTQVIEQVVK